jgi:hypothetical protein
MEIRIPGAIQDHSSVTDSSPVVLRNPFQQQAQPLLHFQHTTNTDTETCITGAMPDNSSVTENGPVVVQKPFVFRRQIQPYPQPYHSHYSCTTDQLVHVCVLRTSSAIYILLLLIFNLDDFFFKKRLFQKRETQTQEPSRKAFRSGYQSGGVPGPSPAAIWEPLHETFQQLHLSRSLR